MPTIVSRSFALRMAVILASLMALLTARAQEVRTVSPEQQAFDEAQYIRDPGARLAALEKIRADFPKASFLGDVDGRIFSTLVANFPNRTDAINQTIDRMKARLSPTATFGERFSTIDDPVGPLIFWKVLLDRAEALLSEASAMLNFDAFAQSERASAERDHQPAPTDAALHTRFDTNYRMLVLEQGGRLRLARGDAAGAERAFKASLALKGPGGGPGARSLADAVVALADEYQARGETAKAEALLKEIHDASPSLRPVILGLADFYVKHGDLAKAEAVRPNFPPLQLMLAEVEAKRGDNAAALDRYLQMAATGNVSGPDYEKMAAVYRKVHGSDTGLEDEVDEVYREKSPNPVTPEPWTKSAARTSRLVVFELFTGSGCPPCAGADLALDGLMERYPADAIVPLVYHVHAPLPDPMTITASKFYRMRGAPSATIDGTLIADEKGGNFGGGARAEAPDIYGYYVPRVDKALETSATAEVTVRATSRGDQVSVTANVTRLPPEAKNLRLQLVLAERELRFSGENGIRFHAMVVRAVAGEQATGLPLTANGKQEYTFNLAAVRADIIKSLAEEIADRRSRQAPGATPAVFAAEGRAMTQIDLGRLVVVAYVQDASKHVLQAARADVAMAPAGRGGG